VADGVITGRRSTRSRSGTARALRGRICRSTFGSCKGARDRLRKRAAGGTREKVFTALLAQAGAEGDLEWGIAVHSTVVRAHQHAVGARPAGRTTMPSDGAAAG
jgi:hypothetical protein